MKKYLTALILTTVLFLGFPSCKDDSIDCTIAGEFFDIIGIETGIYQISKNRFDNGHFWKQVEDDETIPFDKFFMRVFFEVDYYSENQAYLNFDFSNKAYALSCVEFDGYKGSKEKVDTLYVITNNNFNESYSAGDTINEIVEVSGFVSLYREFEDFNPLSTYFDDNQENIQEERFSLKLSQEPTFKDLSHSFKIIYKLENGEVYSDQTETVKFE